MSITDLNAFVALLLAISLAAERFVTFLKNLIPPLADNPRDVVDSGFKSAEWYRRLAVQLLGFVAAWFISGFLTSSDSFTMFGSISLGEKTNHAIPTWAVALLASSGSALWSSLLGLTSAAKDLRKQTVVANSLQARAAQQKALTAPPTFGH